MFRCNVHLLVAAVMEGLAALSDDDDDGDSCAKRDIFSHPMLGEKARTKTVTALRKGDNGPT